MRKYVLRPVGSGLACLLFVVPVLLAIPGAQAVGDKRSAPLTAEQRQRMTRKAAAYAKSRRADKASALITRLLDGASDAHACLELAAGTERIGFPMQGTRRKCMSKALELCKSTDDFMKVAAKCREYQFYELTRDAIERMIQGAGSQTSLFELAALAQKQSLHDVSHRAMAKAYENIKDPREIVDFAFRCKELGLEDLERKSVRNLIDEGKSAHALCDVLKQIDPLGMTDLNRYCLRRALDQGVSLDDCAEVFEQSRRYGQSDIMEVARYRGRKLQIINRMQQNNAQPAAPAQQGDGGF